MERIYKYIRNKMTSNIENLLTTYTKGYHERFTFNLSECTSINGFTFAQGWHFLVETLEQYKKNPSLNYDYSALAMYYERFQPQNLNEVLYGKSIDKYIPELSKYKDPQNAPMPWTPITKLPQKYMTNRSDYGPKSKDSFYGIRRFENLKSIYDSIKANGYDGSRCKLSNHIKAIILKNGDWYRALIVDGNHRVAALAACGYEKVQLRFDYKFPSVVDIENVLYWPCVKLGIYTPDIASKIFLSYFEDSGITKASQFGLLR